MSDTQSQSSVNSKKFNMRDREGHDIFGFSKLGDDSSQAGKRKNPDH